MNKQRMKELREEVGVEESFRKKLVRSRLRWAEHMETMEGVDKDSRCAWSEEEDRVIKMCGD